MNLCVRIQHHPSRADLPARLLPELAGFDDVRVIADPEPAAKPYAWRTHRECLLAMPDDATHLLVLQDDALPVPGFEWRLRAGILENPESVLLPFVPGFRDHLVEFPAARAAGKRFLTFPTRAYVPVVAIVYPAEVVRGLLAWTDAKPRLRGADDSIVALYFRKQKIWPLAFVPCICDHDHTQFTIGQTKKRPGAHRRAALL